jgi:hypothetical protein
MRKLMHEGASLLCFSRLYNNEQYFRDFVVAGNSPPD